MPKPLPFLTLAELQGHLDGLDVIEPATERQLAALDALGLGSAPPALSKAQAGAILSARTYAHAVMVARFDEVTAAGEEGRAYIRALTGYIVRTPDLRERVIAWNGRRMARGTQHGTPSPRRDRYFEMVTEEMRRLARDSMI